MRNSQLVETQAGIKIARGRNINNLRYADDTTLMAESEEELMNLLMKVKKESEKVELKLNIQKTKIMASCPITSWQINGERVETVADFISFGLQTLPSFFNLASCFILQCRMYLNLNSVTTVPSLHFLVFLSKLGLAALRAPG